MAVRRRNDPADYTSTRICAMGIERIERTPLFPNEENVAVEVSDQPPLIGWSEHVSYEMDLVQKKTLNKLCIVTAG